MARGTVKWFNSQKGYGFIQPEGGSKDVFVHISAVERAGLSGLNEGQVVEYEEVAKRAKRRLKTSKFNADKDLRSDCCFIANTAPVNKAPIVEFKGGFSCVRERQQAVLHQRNSSRS